MFRDEDDQQEDSSGAVSKYPCMPSLVALQQMKNRLHLSFVGKKLMKWTAQSTGRELRNISADLMKLYNNFCYDVKDAFLLLARARYFNPNLNKMVLEHVGPKANITVEAKMVSMTGVKIAHLEILDTERDPYPHFGIEKGGCAVQQAKQVWRDMLKRMILIVELRDSFEMVQAANKNAAKKMNVLAKIVIPRALSSIAYILDTLEERAREDFYRFKKIIQNNYKRRQKTCVHLKLATNCPECLKLKSQINDIEEVKEVCVICDSLLHQEKGGVDKKTAIEETKAKQTEENEAKLQEFKEHIGEIVEITKEINEKGIISASIQDFLKTAEQLKNKLEKSSEAKKLKRIPLDSPLEMLCDSCKTRFDQEQLANNIPEKKEELLKQQSTVSSKSVKTELPETNICEKHVPKMETDLELGTFATEIQEITKIIRVRKENGMLSEEKKVIKIKREIRTPLKQKLQPSSASTNPNAPVRGNMVPSSDVSNKSGTDSDTKNTVRAILVQESKTIRSVKSEIMENSATMADPKMRFCVSSMSLTSLVSSNLNLSFLSNVGTLSFDKIRELAASSTNFEEILKLFETNTKNDKVITESIELCDGSCITESDRELITRMVDSTTKSALTSRSGSNIKEEIKKKLKKTSSNSDKKNNDDENQSSAN